MKTNCLEFYIYLASRQVGEDKTHVTGGLFEQGFMLPLFFPDREGEIRVVQRVYG